MEAFIVLADSLHLTEQLSLLFGEIGGKFHLIGDDEVAEGTVTTIVALATQTDFRTRLRFRLNLHLDLLTIRERQDNLTTQQGRIKVDGDVGIHLARMGAR